MNIVDALTWFHRRRGKVAKTKEQTTANSLSFRFPIGKMEGVKHISQGFLENESDNVCRAHSADT